MLSVDCADDMFNAIGRINIDKERINMILELDGTRTASRWVHELCLFFFFQAEDGIRDGRVTGVQTCALPIFQVSDLLVRDSAIEVVDSCSEEVTKALARLVDTVIQTVVNAGTNGVIYSGGKTSRTSLGAGDTLATSDMVRGVKYLRSSNAAGVRPFAGQYYAAIIHPMAMGDLMSTTTTGSWLDVGRYTSVDDLRAGKMGDFRGVRYLESAHQSYYNSTVPVL